MATYFFKCTTSGNILTLVDPSEADLASMESSVKAKDYVRTSKAEADKANKAAADRAALAAADAAAKEKAIAEAEARAAQERAALLALGTAAKGAGLLDQKPAAVVKTPANPEVIPVDI